MTSVQSQVEAEFSHLSQPQREEIIEAREASYYNRGVVLCGLWCMVFWAAVIDAVLLLVA